MYSKFFIKKILFIIMAISLMVAFSACSNEQQNSEIQEEKDVITIEKVFPEFSVISEKQNGELMVVSTTYGDFEFAYAFSDIIKYSAKNGEENAELLFSATINENEYPIFAVYFNDEKGIHLGLMKINGWEEQVPVSVEFFDSEGLDENGVVTFNAAQETFNEVAVSLEKNENFTSEM